MRYYELVVIYDSSLPDETIRAELEKIKNYLQERNGQIVKFEEWGRRRLSYQIRKKDNGFYAFLLITVEDPEIISTLERSLRLNEMVIRHMVIKGQAPKQEEPQPKETGETEATAKEETSGAEAPTVESPVSSDAEAPKATPSTEAAPEQKDTE